MNMKWFYDLRLKWKLVLAFGTIAMVLIASAVTVRRSIMSNAAARAEAHRAAAVVEATGAALGALTSAEDGFRGYLATGSDDDLRAYSGAWAEYRRWSDSIGTLVTSGDTDARARWEELRRSATSLRTEVMDPAVRARRAGTAASAPSGAVVAATSSVRRILVDLLGQERMTIARTFPDTEDAGVAAGRSLLVGTTLAILLMLVAGYALERGVNWPVQELCTKMDAITRGEIELEVWITSNDEMGDLAKALRRVIAAQREFVGVAQRLGQGDLGVAVTPRGERDALAHAFQEMTRSLGDLTRDVQGLIAAARAGDLSQRGDASRYHGAYHDLIHGFNETLDAIVAPVHEAAQVLARVAERDLRARMRGDYRGEHARIKEALTAATDQLSAALSDVSTAAEQVAAGSGQVSAGSQLLAQGAAEQASALEEVASSLQEMGATTRQSATGAREARELAGSARESATRGEQAMRRLAEATERIASASSATARIVKTIDEIAFQTNLLALNAAVEAARAGDAGRGFAVVAEEVRNLAMRSAEAAKNTAGLIDDAIKHAQDGAAIGREALTSFGEISAQVHRVSVAMTDIAEASEQQSRGIDQVSTAVEQMNSVTQQTAANAEESAGAAEELAAQAERLKDLVRHFRVDGVAQSAGNGHGHSGGGVASGPSPISMGGEGNGRAARRASTVLRTGAGVASMPFGEDDQDILEEF